MPEGDTIHRLAARVNAGLAGQVCTTCVTRDPRLVGVDLVGSTLVDAVAVGKHLLVRFSDRIERTLHIHLGMDGRVLIVSEMRGAAWRRRIELGFGERTMIGLDLPVVELIPTSMESSVVGHLGPDLSTGVAAAPAGDRLVSDPGAPLAGALLDQRNLAGLGNVFAVEVPFIVGVDPHQAVGSIDRLDIVVDVAAALIGWSTANGVRNTTGRRLHAPDHWVYGHAGSPCPLCGTRLRGESADNSPWRRVTVWCPSCQPVRPLATVDQTRISRLLRLHPALRSLNPG